MGLDRSLAFTALLEWSEFAALPMGDASRVLDDFALYARRHSARAIELVVDEYRRLITSPEGDANSLTSYVAALRAGDAIAATRGRERP